MAIYVCIKQVPDTETKIKLNDSKSGIDPNGVKWIMNPYDEFAVEEALKLKTSNNEKVVIFSVGPKKRIVDSIRTALAMGADEGVAIDAPEDLDSFITAKALAAAIKAEGEEFSQIFTGKLAIDFNQSSVSQQLAEFLGIPHATVVTQYSPEDGRVTVHREIEGGSKEIMQLIGKNLVAANKGLNSPRYASLPGIMKAKKKPLKETDLASLGVSAEDAKSVYTNYELPPEKPPVKMLEGDAESMSKQLASLLREEAKVI
ncbi:MAG: electron transfer flavoprotein subunit beta/FixA family protein [Bdellovibrionales bacterium]|nr:electron transfer flavoprotein subunit beta/FixA family protein [Bdellovibrionales bacterium]